MVTAFIPVRGGSKSIPLKNIRPFCGKPLVWWNVEALQNCPLVDRIVVATDSPEIEQTVGSFGLDKVVLYHRSAANASDTASTESVMLEYIEAASMDPSETFMLVQATSPMTSTADFTKGLEMFATGEYDSILTCVRNKRFFWSEDGKSLNYDWLHRPRRQEFAGMMMENGAFYINTVAGILASGNRLGGRIGVCEMPEYTAIEIDEPDDWFMLEKLMRRHCPDRLAPVKGQLKLFLSDVDGTLTDGGMYYAADGSESKKFNTRDGMAFSFLRERGIKTGFVTSEVTDIVERRAKKLQCDFLVQGKRFGGKVEAVKQICAENGFDLSEVAYIGDDVNCVQLLSSVGYAACPADACSAAREVPGIYVSPFKGGDGCVRDFIERLLSL
ncbi:MAG: acylneuraminate cytidylyltransferase [Bacteroidales bacterium]|nr:acylneuraminate cytidylyltransferase [Candidatus Cryptobacteroides choladohippi]MCQ2115723.1 acylneuraminate cytidylyltransferase [Bacteroidales bacterium]